MNNKISKILSEVITECECDTRIESGIFDLYNADHLVIMVEHLAQRGISEEISEEILETSLFDEGKYPERQAYNKEGWLVTFPSKEYRDAAIKKRTHFGSDPTHGKGGMNLYYKKKGKKKRQKVQTTTTTQSQGEKPTTAAPQQKPQTQPQVAKQGDSSKTLKTPQQQAQPTDVEDTDFDSRDDDLERYIAAKSGGKFKSKYSQPTQTTQPSTEPSKPAEAPAIDVPVVTAPPKQYSEVSKKFASQKRWVATPYDEYHDAEGNVVAVVGLSGEIVPVKNTDREEYKIFAEKNMPL